MKSVLKKAGLIAAPLALAIGLGGAIAAPQTGDEKCCCILVPT